VHPDRFAAQGDAAQRIAMQWAVRVNEAYQRLKDPLRRAAYLCELSGAPINAENNTAMPAAFLMQQMAWREALDEAPDLADVQAIDDEVAQAERPCWPNWRGGWTSARRSVCGRTGARADVRATLPPGHRPSPRTSTAEPDSTTRAFHMALLQISEPGQSPDPHQRRIAVGIDLGTTHSLVAALRHGVAECLPDAQGRLLLPSVVRYLDGGRRLIGDAAREHQAEDPENTLVSVKRFMGRKLADIADRASCPTASSTNPAWWACRPAPA
jgi:hypothetical protein